MKSSEMKINHTPKPLRERIDAEDLKQLERESFNGKIVVVDNPRDVADAVAVLKQESVLGFDTETKPSFRKGKKPNVALLQLSTQKISFLFRLNKIGLSSAIVDILSATDIYKVGIDVRQDYIGLTKLAEFTPAGFVDLQKICPAYGVKDSSLQKIYAILFNKRISKSQRLSNWENEELTESQQAYAALDAWAGLKIYEWIMSKPMPNPIAFGLV